MIIFLNHWIFADVEEYRDDIVRYPMSSLAPLHADRARRHLPTKRTHTHARTLAHTHMHTHARNTHNTQSQRSHTYTHAGVQVHAHGRHGQHGVTHGEHVPPRRGAGMSRPSPAPCRYCHVAAGVVQAKELERANEREGVGGRGDQGAKERESKGKEGRVPPKCCSRIIMEQKLLANKRCLATASIPCSVAAVVVVMVSVDCFLPSPLTLTYAIIWMQCSSITAELIAQQDPTVALLLRCCHAYMFARA